jgi:hypothetical protein
VFDVADAVSLAAVQAGEVALHPPLAALPRHPVQALDAADLRRTFAGIAVPAAVSGRWGALTDAASGRLVALAERVAERWQPRVVLHD